MRIIKRTDQIFNTKIAQKTFDDYIGLAELIESLDSTNAVHLKHFFVKNTEHYY